jgi:MFS family permease
MTLHTLRHSWLVSHSPVFYGWVVWIVATIGLIATTPGQNFSVSLFIDHYIVEFGLDRTTISGLYGFGTFVAAVSLPTVGRMIDRYGNRRMSMAISGIFGVVLLASTQISGPFSILLSFIAIRSLGQGALGLVNTTAIAQWFQKRRGWMISLSLLTFAVFQRFYPPWMQQFIDQNGWQVAWLIFGVIMLVVVLPLLAIFLRDNPEDFGLDPDGQKAPPLPEGTTQAPDWTLQEARRTTLFWVFMLARMLAGTWGGALIFHQISIFATLGHSPEVATSIFGQAALMTALMTLFSGWAVDHIKPGALIAIQMVALIVTCITGLTMHQEWQLFVYSLSFGAFMGIGSVFDGTVWVKLFGRSNQGAIRGVVATAMVLGTALGPLVFGWSYDNLGGYNAPLYLGVGLAVVAFVSALIVKLPTHPSQR